MGSNIMSNLLSLWFNILVFLLHNLMISWGKNKEEKPITASHVVARLAPYMAIKEKRMAPYSIVFLSPIQILLSIVENMLNSIDAEFLDL